MSEVAVIMGSQSDWSTMKETCDMLGSLGVTYEKQIISAHRTPDLLFDFAENAQQRGIQVIVAGAGGAAHLPGMVASKSLLPVIGVPVASKHLQGMDSLLSIVQMPGGVPVATVAIGTPGAKNAGILAAQIVALQNKEVAKKLTNYRQSLTDSVMESRRDFDTN